MQLFPGYLDMAGGEILRFIFQFLMTHSASANEKLMKFVVAGDRIIYPVFFWLKLPVKNGN